MFLKNIYVRENWLEHARLAERHEETWWKATIIAVVISLALIVLIKRELPEAGSPFLAADGIAGALYLIIGILSIARLTNPYKWLFGAGFLIVFGGILASDLLVLALIRVQGPQIDWFYMASIGLVLLVPGWGLLCILFFRNRKEITEGLNWRWWIRRVVVGIGAGAALSTVLFLSASFADVRWSIQIPPVAPLLQHVIYALGVRSPGEELVFRGIILHYLYRRRGLGYWPAILITLPLNLSIYVVELPQTSSPEVMTLALIGPCLMAIASAVLYIREGSLIAPMVNNAIFQIFSYVIGLR